MALGANTHTMLDLLQATGANWELRPFINSLALMTPQLQYLPIMEANSGDFHEISHLTGKPQVSRGETNNEYIPSKSHRAKTRFTCTNLMSSAQYEQKALQRFASNAAAYKAQCAQVTLQTLSEECGSAMFYDNEALNPNKATGLQAYYNTLGTSNNVLSAAGATANAQASMYLVGMGDMGFHGIYPRGTQAGVKVQSKTDIVLPSNITPGATAIYDVDYFDWYIGFVLADPYTCVRIANIDVAAIRAGVTVDLVNLAIDAVSLAKANSRPTLRYAWMAPPAVVNYLTKLVLSQVKAGGGLTFENFEGRRIVSLWGFPVLECDGMSLTEAVVS